MSIEQHFNKADATINYIDSHVPTLTDGVLSSQFVGFCAITAVTVYELAIKEISINFASGKHKVFGNFLEQQFSRLNGRIRYSELVNIANRFGAKYATRFKKKVEEKEKIHLKTYRRSHWCPKQLKVGMPVHVKSNS